MTYIKNSNKSESLVCAVVLNDTEKSKSGLRSVCVTVKEAPVWNLALGVLFFFVLWRDNSQYVSHPSTLETESSLGHVHTDFYF